MKQDHAEAMKWYRLAAGQGLISAQLILGVMYEEGHGVKPDNVQAHKWFDLAAAHSRSSGTEDHDLAIKRRDLVAAKMTPAQIEEAQRLAREWKPE